MWKISGNNVFSYVPQLGEYLLDASQRSVLFWDVMRRRGNQFFQYMEAEVHAEATNVLQFTAKPVMSGRELAKPVNYDLVRIAAPEGVATDELKRPFVVVDPRAGHGPGIGGFKADSEIGVALEAGHPCYFIGFLPEPVPGQTILDVMQAEAQFLKKVAELHPLAEGKPVVIGNCQAGWAVMMLASAYPELCGPLILAGAPLSYWDGVRGINPMRYSGGLLGGSWMTALTGDIGNGKFDGAWLVQNFEWLNPANTLWAKQYNLYSRIDTEGPRYLGFERWWGGHVILNADEMQFIVDNLFVGNKLSTAGIVTDDDIQLDFRNIQSPIICLCSKGDDITPPQQALGWIPDLYESVEGIRAMGQTIVYAIHESVGHLGIFVSGSVAKKEHKEFTHNIDFIDCLPPGLYQAVIEVPGPDAANPELINAEYISRFEGRTLDDICALGRNSLEEERCFAAAKRLSETNLGLYKTVLQPGIRAVANEPAAKFSRDAHPLRLGYAMVSDRNPAAKVLEPASKWALENRKPVSPENIFWKMQECVSNVTSIALDGFREWCGTMSELAFFGIYGNPLLQAVLGLRASDEPPLPLPGKNPKHMAYVRRRMTELRNSMDQGGVRAAVLRAILYVSWEDNSPDERMFEMLNKIRRKYAEETTLRDLKQAIRTQAFMLYIDEEKALDTIPALLDGQGENVPTLLAIIRETVTAQGPLGEEAGRRMARIEDLFAMEEKEVGNAAT